MFLCSRHFLIVFSSIFFYCEAHFSQVYNFRNYSVEDGIAQSQVYSMLQDKRGNIWFGTRGGGLTKFDGVNFKTYSEKDGLINNYISGLIQDANNKLWIATNNGLSYYNGVRFLNYPLKSKYASIQILNFDQDEQLNLWLATSNGLYRFDGKKFYNVSKELKIPVEVVYTVLVDNQGDIWFGDRKGLHQLKRTENGHKLIHLSESSSFMANAISCLKQDRKGNLWIGTFGDGAYQYDGKKFFRFDHNHELYKVTILDIFIDSKQNFWFGTLNHGVFHYQPNESVFTQFTENEGLSNNHVRKTIQDNAGNYWFGTSGGGVCNYLGKQFTSYDKSSGLGGSFIYSIYRDSQNRLWIGNSQKGVSFYENGKFINKNASTGFLDVKVKSIIEAWDEEVYLGTEGKGVYSYKDSVFTELEALSRTFIRGMTKDKKGNIWIATAGHGIFKLNKENGTLHVKNILVTNGLLSNRLTTITCDNNGRIWYGTENNGIGCLDHNGNKIYKLTIKDGLTSNNIRSLALDKRGNLWIGTAGSGVNAISIDNPKRKARIIDYKQGLTSTNIYLIVFDDLDNLIIGTEKGLDYVQLNDQLNVTGIKHYSKGDGFTGVETCQNAVFKDPDGTIWFGTINGLIKFNPSNLVKNTIPPIIYISDVKLFYESLNKTKFRNYVGDWNTIKPIHLPYNQNHITFEFFAVNLSNPEGVKYRWKLEGFDGKWSPVSTDKSILYSNLNPGSYRFLVQASNEDGIWTKDPAVLTFTIASPFWYSWWFITIITLGIIALMYLAIRIRFQALKQKANEKMNQLKMEKEIVELEQKALRLQMNPHFIFNALNSIQSQIGTGNDKEARYYLAKFSRLMRQILDNSRNTAITLQEEINTLENYLLIEKFCNGDRFDYEIKIPDEIESDFIRIPPMIIQPFIENAIKHGLRDLENLGRRGKITISFRENKDCLICSIEDNGIGRVKSAEMNKASKETYHKSTALLVTQERLELLNEGDRFESMEIIDLYDNGDPSGTKVIIRIPTI